MLETYKNKAKNLIRLILISDPPKTALSVTFGFYLGIFPIVGTATVLCVVAAIIFRLDHLITQLVNAVVFPIQLLFIIPFYKMGYLLIVKNPDAVQPNSVIKIFTFDSTITIYQILASAFGSIVVWGLFFATTSIFFYHIILTICKRLYDR